jgi:hypothetical protein
LCRRCPCTTGLSEHNTRAHVACCPFPNPNALFFLSFPPVPVTTLLHPLSRKRQKATLNTHISRPCTSRHLRERERQPWQALHPSSHSGRTRPRPTPASLQTRPSTSRRAASCTRSPSRPPISPYVAMLPGGAVRPTYIRAHTHAHTHTHIHTHTYTLTYTLSLSHTHRLRRRLQRESASSLRVRRAACSRIQRLVSTPASLSSTLPRGRPSPFLREVRDSRYIHTYAHTRTHSRTHTHARTHVHTHAHTHTHAPRRLGLCVLPTDCRVWRRRVCLHSRQRAELCTHGVGHHQGRKGRSCCADQAPTRPTLPPLREPSRQELASRLHPCALLPPYPRVLPRCRRNLPQGHFAPVQGPIQRCCPRKECVPFFAHAPPPCLHSRLFTPPHCAESLGSLLDIGDFLEEAKDRSAQFHVWTPSGAAVVAFTNGYVALVHKDAHDAVVSLEDVFLNSEAPTPFLHLHSPIHTHIHIHTYTHTLSLFLPLPLSLSPSLPLSLSASCPVQVLAWYCGCSPCWG